MEAKKASPNLSWLSPIPVPDDEVVWCFKHSLPGTNWRVCAMWRENDLCDLAEAYVFRGKD